jgi:hypothetical protein
MLVRSSGVIVSLAVVAGACASNPPKERTPQATSSATTEPDLVPHIEYEAFAFSPNGHRKRLASGVQSGETSRDQTIQLEGGFAISASVNRQPKVPGFGLTVRHSDYPNGFSWEWFDLRKGHIFHKRQGSGRLAVTLATGPGYEELQSIRFLDDIVLRFRSDIRQRPASSPHTHEVVVRKGSVLASSADW